MTYTLAFKQIHYSLTPFFFHATEDQEKRDIKINSQLEENASLLEQLSREQHERLSRPLPASLNNLVTPSQQELQLGEPVSCIYSVNLHINYIINKFVKTLT